MVAPSAPCIRLKALGPFLNTGQIQLQRKHRVLIEQLKYFPKGRHDDGPDALEMLFQVEAKQRPYSGMSGGLFSLPTKPDWL